MPPKQLTIDGLSSKESFIEKNCVQLLSYPFGVATLQLNLASPDTNGYYYLPYLDNCITAIVLPLDKDFKLITDRMDGCKLYMVCSKTSLVLLHDNAAFQFRATSPSSSEASDDEFPLENYEIKDPQNPGDILKPNLHMAKIEFSSMAHYQQFTSTLTLLLETSSAAPSLPCLHYTAATQTLDILDLSHEITKTIQIHIQ